MTVSMPVPFVSPAASRIVVLSAGEPQTIAPHTWTALHWDTVHTDPEAGFDPAAPDAWTVPATGLYQAALANLTIEHRERLVVTLGVLLDGRPVEGTVFTRALHGNTIWDDDLPIDRRPAACSPLPYAAACGPEAGQRLSLAIHCAKGPLVLRGERSASIAWIH